MNSLFYSEAYAPDIDAEKFPAAQHVRSIHNTPIEGAWHWFLNTLGFNIKDRIRQGYQDGIYNPGNPVHPYVQLLALSKLNPTLLHLLQAFI